ncbi:hypothetical protein C8F04DRAFT_1192657 [Mycena alexandri]|uniref:Uncharacterized protein n=1 Tax=Mycena alexandri TaxID=1745969 RepID=A0AAD6SB33_9AGAR|nr:hypothetical protein C8F04DRAFT_1192657 [Mycena alexandri]
MTAGRTNPLKPQAEAEKHDLLRRVRPSSIAKTRLLKRPIVVSTPGIRLGREEPLTVEDLWRPGFGPPSGRTPSFTLVATVIAIPPFRGQAVEASMTRVYRDWDTSVISYDWDGLTFPVVPRKFDRGELNLPLNHDDRPFHRRRSYSCLHGCPPSRAVAVVGQSLSLITTGSPNWSPLTTCLWVPRPTVSSNVIDMGAGRVFVDRLPQSSLAFNHPYSIIYVPPTQPTTSSVNTCNSLRALNPWTGNILVVKHGKRKPVINVEKEDSLLVDMLVSE